MEKKLCFHGQIISIKMTWAWQSVKTLSSVIYAPWCLSSTNIFQPTEIQKKKQLDNAALYRTTRENKTPPTDCSSQVKSSHKTLQVVFRNKEEWFLVSRQKRTHGRVGRSRSVAVCDICLSLHITTTRGSGHKQSAAHTFRMSGTTWQQHYRMQNRDSVLCVQRCRHANLISKAMFKISAHIYPPVICFWYFFCSCHL